MEQLLLMRYVVRAECEDGYDDVVVLATSESEAKEKAKEALLPESAYLATILSREAL